MSFDKPTRNRLQNLVASCRRALQTDIEDQLQSRYGMYRADERIQPLGELSALSFEDQDIAAQLRDLFSHYRAQEPDFTAAYDRLVHEIGFTSLNRLVALRLAEERGYIVECVRRALDSEGFRIYQLIVEDQLGTPFETYRFFLHLIFDEMAVDLHFLFDRSLPQGLVFPSEPVLRKVLADLSAADLVPLWKEDETIGWVYQFFNDPEERQRMRAESNAPRNSREMAVRNQFFTPRYVVEFLVDNTLGRTWIEMRQGKTVLRESCQYLLRRTDEVFLDPREFGGGGQVAESIQELLSDPFDVPEEGDEESWKTNFDRAWGLAHQINGYRSPQWTDRENTPAHYARLEPEADPLCADDLTTQEILEAMYLRLRGDRMMGSPDSAQNPRLYEAANEVRRRYQQSTKPEATKEELLAAPFFVPFRAEKDPRDLKILDPACGSGHFLLYSFDLLEGIYREAWNEPSDPAPKSLVTGQTLREDFESLESLEKALPGLILANNLFGVDIDPRAAQISAVALWLRAQRGYQEAGLRNMTDRPQITKMNFVVAEPMPGEADLKREFLATLRPRVVGQVAEKVFDVMRLAGEAGVLLRVEQALSDTVTAARKQWEAEREVPEGLFPELAKPSTKSLFDVSDIDDDAFWEIAEETILGALANFAQKAEGSDPLRRRLFADDSARGFAFIDLCRTRFDAFLMNPPFGEPTRSTKPILELDYQDAKSDVLQAFVERGGEMLVPGGMLGCISSRTPFFLGGSQDFRERVVLRLFRPSVFVDLGHGVMDAAMVEAAAFTIRTLNTLERQALINDLSIEANEVSGEKGGTIRRAQWESIRGLKRLQAEQELNWLEEAGILRREVRETKASRVTVWVRTTQALSTRASKGEKPHPIPFVRTIGEAVKDMAVLAGLAGLGGLYFATITSLRKIPGVPFAYWIRDSVRNAFVTLPTLDSKSRKGQFGLSTKDDFRFLRLWWEVEPKTVCGPELHPRKWEGPYRPLAPKWFLFSKGGESIGYYNDVHLLVNAKRDFDELSACLECKYPSLGDVRSWILHPENDYFRAGLTWTKSTTKPLTVRVLPSGCYFSDVGPAFFAPSNQELLSLCGVMNSLTFKGLVYLRLGLADAGRKHYEVGLIRGTPFESSLVEEEAGVLHLAKVLVASRQVDVSRRETALLALDLLGRDDRGELATSSTILEMEQLVSNGYGLDSEDYAQLTASLDSLQSSEDLEEDPEESGSHKASLSPADNLSYYFGCALGRWDIRLQMGLRGWPALPDPFEALPICPPGMLQGNDSLPAITSPAGYPLEIPWDGILVDDPGDGPGEENSSDIILRIRRAISLIMGKSAGEFERELTEGLDVETLRDYMRKPAGFFAHHLKLYSKSRRRAPIYWPLGTSSGSYTLWLYYPRLTEQTLYAAVESYVRPKLASVGRQRDSLEVQLRDNPLASAKDRERLTRLRAFSQELADLQDELLRVAALPYKPDLDDGVVINAAPLRKLFRYKPWVKELEEVWKKLEKGEYDWSRMAFHLWPDRVRAKCVKDRSLAIAHDLEWICIAPDPTKNGGQKRGRKKKEAALIEEEDE